MCWHASRDTKEKVPFDNVLTENEKNGSELIVWDFPIQDRILSINTKTINNQNKVAIKEFLGTCFRALVWVVRLDLLS